MDNYSSGKESTKRATTLVLRSSKKTKLSKSQIDMDFRKTGQKFDMDKSSTHNELSTKGLSNGVSMNTQAARSSENNDSIQMLKQSLIVQSCKPTMVSARTTKGVSYHKFALKVVVPLGTLIFVDVNTNIALIGQDHVDVGSDEYTVLS